MWIKLELNTPDKPEVHLIAAALEISTEHALGCLCRIWIWADEQSLDGNALSVTESVLDRIASVTGFGKAMREVGWLTGSDGALCLPNFNNHNGETAKKRSLTARRAATHRQRNRNAPSVTSALPREDKIREDIRPPANAAPPLAKKARKTEVPPDFAISDRVRKWAVEKGHGQYLDSHLEAFIRKCQANGYTYANHDSAFIEAVRENWAKIGIPASKGNGSRSHAPEPDPNAGTIVCETCGTRVSSFVGRQCGPCWRKPPEPRASV